MTTLKTIVTANGKEWPAKYHTLLSIVILGSHVNSKGAMVSANIAQREKAVLALAKDEAFSAMCAKNPSIDIVAEIEGKKRGSLTTGKIQELASKSLEFLAKAKEYKAHKEQLATVANIETFGERGRKAQELPAMDDAVKFLEGIKVNEQPAK